MVIALSYLVIIALLSVCLSDSYYKRLHAYRKKYGFDRTLEISDLGKSTLKNSIKVNKILDRREKTHHKNINAEPSRQNNESLIQFIKRRFHRV